MVTLKWFSKAVVIAIVTTLSLSAFAQSKEEKAAFNRLLKYKYRPTVAEFMTEFGNKIPAASLFTANRIEQIEKGGPELIASLEFVYPNGIYAALGRDSFLMADIIDAFYLRYGIPGRAAYLHASGPTVYDMANKKKILAFLKSNGFGNVARPFVIMDRTSMGGGSQSTQLYDSAYNYYSRQGLTDQKIVRLLGVASTHPGIMPKDLVKLTTAKRKGVALGLGDLPEVSTFTDIGFWSGSYGDLVAKPVNGVLRGELTPENNKEQKAQVLSLIYECVIATSKPSFLNRVRKLAEKLGYDFAERLSPKTIAEAQGDFERYMKEQEEKMSLAEKAESVTAAIKELLVSKFILPAISRPQIEGQDFDISAFDALKIWSLPKIEEFAKHSVKAAGNNAISKEAPAFAEAFVAHLNTDFVTKIQTSTGNLSTGQDMTGLPYVLALMITGDEHPKGQYLSENGKEAFDYLDGLLNNYSASQVATEVVFEALMLAKAEKRISSKDLRRTVLMLFSKFNIKTDITALAKIVNSSANLKNLLVTKNEVFLTSKRYEGVAAKIYKKLVKDGALPTSALHVECKNNLKPAEEGEGEGDGEIEAEIET